MLRSESDHVAHHHLSSKRHTIPHWRDMDDHDETALEYRNIGDHYQAPPLPDLVWRGIVHHLRDYLPILLDLAGLSRELQDICRPHISTFFSCIRDHVPPPLSPQYFYHDILRLIWKGDIDPELITDFHHIYQHEVPPPLPSRARPGLPDNATETEIHKFDVDYRRALEKNSAYIPADLHDEICTRFQHGDHDAALMVLLPLLTRLKTLEIPSPAPLCSAYFSSLGKEYSRRGINPVEARDRAYKLALRDRNLPPGHKSPRDHQQQPSPYSELPFTELLILHTRAADHGCGPSLPSTLPFLALPSLHRIVLQGVCGGPGATFPGWRDHEPRPTCPEIYFQQSELPRSLALVFAQGLRTSGTVDIKQWFEHHKLGHGWTDVQSIGWDHIIVTRKNVSTIPSIPTSSKTASSGISTSPLAQEPEVEVDIDINIDYQGGNPGYEHAWVSTLWHGKMLDWRTLDSVFELEEGDEENDWLQGMLCW